jgi:hypothetical protein
MSSRLFVFTVNPNNAAHEKSYLYSTTLSEHTSFSPNFLLRGTFLSFAVDKIVTDKQMGGKVFLFI